MEPEGGSSAAGTVAWSGVRRIAADLVAESQRGLRQRRAAASLAAVAFWWMASDGANIAIPLAAGLLAVIGLWHHRARGFSAPAVSLRRGVIRSHHRERSTAVLAAAGSAMSLLLGAEAGWTAPRSPLPAVLALSVVLHAALSTVELFGGRAVQPNIVFSVAAAVPPVAMLLLGWSVLSGTLALLLPVLAVVISVVDARDVVSWQRQLRQRVWAVKAEVQAVDARHIHQVKNVARLVYDDVESPDARFKAGVRQMVLMLSGLEDSVRSGRDAHARSATEIVAGLRDLDSTVSRSVVVLSDVEPSDLDPSDVELMTFVLGDLISNAVRAESQRTTVEVIAHHEIGGSRIVVTVACECGTPVGPVQEGSSLLHLAGMLALAGGELVLEDGGLPSHRFVAAWPCARLVRTRAVPSGAGRPAEPEVGGE